MLQFLCYELCEINSSGVARITWNIFYGSLARALNKLHDPTAAAKHSHSEEQLKDVHLQRLRFLLAHCCPRLKDALLTAGHYRGLTEVYNYRDDEAFALFLQHMNPDQLTEACEFFDSMYQQKPSDDLKNFRTVLRRQRTITLCCS